MQKNVIKTTILAVAVASLSGCAWLDKPGKNSAVNQQEGQLHIKALIDGRDIMFVQGNKIWIQHEAYVFPGKWAGQDLPITLNHGKNNRDGRKGQEWKLEWNGNLTKQEIIMDSPPIPNTGKWDEDNFKVKFSTIGYGIASVKQYPSEANGYTLVMEFDDVEPDGAHWYSADIDWTDPK